MPEPEETEVGITVVGSVRIRCVLDPEWVSVICLRVAPNEQSQYLGVVTGVDTDTPNLHLISKQSWRFPTPELRETMRREIVRLYRHWRQSRMPRPS
ncbi:hypothetical protein [Glycomyces tarimensis]